jgi:hypothetical protein
MNVPHRVPNPSEAAFQALMREVMADADHFGHRQHVRLTWLAVRRYGTAAALELVGEGIRQAASDAGAPQKYHATVARAWVELVGHQANRTDTRDFDAFTEQHAELLDKQLLDRYYRPETLASDRARTTWVEPDLSPFPWHLTDR